MLQGVAIDITIANDSNDDGLNQSFMAHVSPSTNQIPHHRHHHAHQSQREPRAAAAEE